MGTPTTLTPKRRARLQTRHTFTVGDVVALLEVSPRRVCAWVDDGTLPGTRVGADRRIFRAGLVRFLRERDDTEALALLGDGPALPAAPAPVPAAPDPRAARLRGKRSFSTSDVGFLCGVSSKTVSTWIDNGVLPGLRLPGKTDRRVPRGTLVAFLRERGFADGLALLDGGRHVLAVGLDGLAAPLAAALPAGSVLDTAESVWAAAVLFQEHRPAAVVLGETLGRAVCREVLDAVRREAVPPHVIAVRPESEGPGWLGSGVAEAEPRVAAVLAALGW